MFILKSKLDTTGVKQGAAQFQATLKDDLSATLNDVKARATEAEKSLKGMLDLGKIQAAAGAFGAVKGILDKVGVSVLGLSESTNKAVTSTLELAAQGVAAGAAFGPIGALIGGVSGALLGYASATETAKEATEALARAERERQEQLRLDAALLDKAADAATKFAAIQKSASIATTGDEFGLVGKSVADVTDIWLEAAEDIVSIGEAAASSKATLDELTASGDANAEVVAIESQRLEDYGRMLGEAIRKKSAAKSMLDDLTKSHKVNTSAVQVSTKAIEDRVAAINAETAAMLERRAVADEAATDRASEDGLLDKSGLAEMREEATALTAATLEAFDKLSLLPDIQLPMVELDAMDEALRAMGERAAVLGDKLQDALANVGSGAAKTLFDNIEAGKKITDGLGASFEKLAAQQLRAIGETLVGEGIRTELEAARLLIQSAGLDPRGIALATLGGAEIATGLAMGAGGALLGRRSSGQSSGGDPPASDSLGSREPEAGPRDLRPVVINFNSTIPATERGAQEQADAVLGILGTRR